eukprot:6126535-Amphidinium_carterae.2
MVHNLQTAGSGGSRYAARRGQRSDTRTAFTGTAIFLKLEKAAPILNQGPLTIRCEYQTGEESEE